jgi:Alpha/beta hydrolase domain
MAFGDRGSYERIDGVLRFAVDPDHEANWPIVDLDKAERDGEGRVRFESDFCLLRPVEPERGNRGLFLHVPNRGRVGSLAFSGLAYPAEITERIAPGDGFLLRHGWTVLWCGWQWDVVRRPGLLGLEAPQAVEDGRPIRGWVRIQFQPNEPHPHQLLAHWPLHPAPGNPSFKHRPYPAAEVEDREAVLSVREWADGPRATIPRGHWRFARDEGGRPVADDAHVWLEGGFRPGKLYEVAYRTRICPVVGTGLLAIRDAASFFRHGSASEGNPSAGQIGHTVGFGISQCGRMLRDFLYYGLNLDEAGRPAFDGLMPHVAGARRGEFNFRYAQPSAQHIPGLGHLFPFAHDEQTDPETGRTDGLLRRQRALGGVPKIVETNSSSEYWRSDCSLVHTDVHGERDVEPPGGVRLYLFAGTQHGAGLLPPHRDTTYGARGSNVMNLVDYTALGRAALVNLERWVVQGVEPPPSIFPRLAHGAAVSRGQVLDQFRAVPGAALPDPERLPTLHRLELPPSAATGSGPEPAPEGSAYPCYVSVVDSDLNESAGIRLPDLTVPLASHAGWNPRDPETGAPDQIVDMYGSTLPFPADADARRRTGDPRPSIAERYRDRDQYLRRVRAEAEQLVAQRYLLAEDVDLIVQNCAARWDALVPTVTAAHCRLAGKEGTP